MGCPSRTPQRALGLSAHKAVLGPAAFCLPLWHRQNRCFWGTRSSEEVGVWNWCGCQHIGMAGGGADYAAEGLPAGSEYPLALSPAQGCWSGFFLLARTLGSACSSSVSLSLSLISMLFSQDPKLSGCSTITLGGRGNIFSPCQGEGTHPLHPPTWFLQKRTLSGACL